MPFHKHCPIDNLLVLRQSHLYSYNGLREFKHLVNTHVYIGQFKKSLQFLVNLKCHKTDTHMSFNPALREMRHGTYLYLRF